MLIAGGTDNNDFIDSSPAEMKAAPVAVHHWSCTDFPMILIEIQSGSVKEFDK